MIVLFVSLFIIFYLRIIEIARLVRLHNIYFHKCQPKQFLEEQRKMKEEFLFDQHQKLKYDFLQAMTLIDAGLLNEAKDRLNILNGKIYQLQASDLFGLLTIWVYYFDECNNLELMEIYINKIRTLIIDFPSSLKSKAEHNFRFLQARFFVRSNIYIDSAESIFNDIFKGKHQMLNVIKSMYFLGLIALHQNKPEVALERLNFIIHTKKEQLLIYHKSLKIVEDIKGSKTAV